MKRTSSWCSSYGLLFLGDCSIELIEETQDDQREAYWIQKLYSVNKNRMEHGIGELLDIHAKNRAYYVVNQESMKAKKKAHYAANRDRVLQKARVRVICDRCGTETSRNNVVRHSKSDKCKRLSRERSKY